MLRMLSVRKHGSSFETADRILGGHGVISNFLYKVICAGPSRSRSQLHLRPPRRTCQSGLLRGAQDHAGRAGPERVQGQDR